MDDVLTVGLIPSPEVLGVTIGVDGSSSSSSSSTCGITTTCEEGTAARKPCTFPINFLDDVLFFPALDETRTAAIETGHVNHARAVGAICHIDVFQDFR